ncbi:hypothetical protein TNCV_1714001 [Trichonephila clavipes]|nr:hypothetical protein TNCV_1714001 [Trichonephila clavipes]
MAPSKSILLLREQAIWGQIKLQSGQNRVSFMNLQIKDVKEIDRPVALYEATVFTRFFDRDNKGSLPLPV